MLKKRVKDNKKREEHLSKMCFIPRRFVKGREPSKFPSIRYMRKKTFNDRQQYRISAKSQKLTWNNLSIRLKEEPEAEKGSTTLIGTPDNEDFSLLFASYMCRLSGWRCLWMKMGDKFFIPKRLKMVNSVIQLVIWNISEVLPKEMYQPFKSFIWGVRDRYHIIIVTPANTNPIDWHKETLGYSPDIPFVVNGESYKNINAI